MGRHGKHKRKHGSCNLFNRTPVYVIHNENYRSEQNQQAIEQIKNSQVVGFDTESRVDWAIKKGPNQLPICLIQLANEDVVILWRLRKFRRPLFEQFPSQLREILTSESIMKVGIAVHDDDLKICKDYNVTPKNIFDAVTLAKELGIVECGLKSLSLKLLHMELPKSKKVTLGNWEIDRLSDEQISYAATDAWASLMIYKELHRLKMEKDPMLKTEKDCIDLTGPSDFIGPPALPEGC